MCVCVYVCVCVCVRESGQVEEIEGLGKQLHVTALRYDVVALERELQRLAEDRGAQARIDSDWTQVGGGREAQKREGACV